MSEDDKSPMQPGGAEIPVVDLLTVGLGKQGSEQDLQAAAAEIHEALSTIGFVYLINHGIPQEQVYTTFLLITSPCVIWRGTNIQETFPY